LGQLGLNTYILQYITLKKVLDVGGYDNISGITQIEAGKNHSIFLHNSGLVYSCGDNKYGQLGIGNLVSSNCNTLQIVKGLNGIGLLSGITQISSKNDFSMFLHVSGDVYCCGYNKFGQLGIGNTVDQYNIVKAPYISNIKQITTGENHSIFLHNSGIVYSCGENRIGQLGISNMVNMVSSASDEKMSFDNGLLNRGSIDTVATTFVNLINLNVTIGMSLNSWSLYVGSINKYITPLILEDVGSTNYVVRGIGTARYVSTAGINSYNFDVVEGSDIFVSSAYRFGWKDGTPTSANAGVISYAGGNPVAQTTYALSNNSSTNISLNQTYTFGNTGLGNRSYSFKLDFAFTSIYITTPQIVNDLDGSNLLSGITHVAAGYSHSIFLNNSTNSKNIEDFC